MKCYASACLATAALAAFSPFALTTLLVGCSTSHPASTSKEKNENQRNAPVLALFAGSTPCDDSIRSLLQIPPNVDAHLIQWKLTLRHDPKTFAPADYQLHYVYGLTVPRQPGLDANAKRLEM